ncbi:hypothetical protein [Methanobacterium sp. MBAC-LM]|uniref:hypothetical protein n=1 Tax=Methanobacterium sp. MBAC-LM TaxID=3412034 RepID=UPI003C7562FE
MENIEVELRHKKPISEKDLWKIKKCTNNAFNKIGSDSYRQKIVYKLLNAAKSSNQREFFSILLRTLNGQKSDEDVKELLNKLQEIYPLTSKSFENVTYSIIMGIMSAESIGGN